MHDGALRYDDTREGQLGDILFFEEVLDVGIYGAKTDTLLRGQTAQLPRCAPQPGRGPPGSAALVDSVHLGLLRLISLPHAVIAATGARLSAAHPRDNAGPEALSTWPHVLQPLFRTLYERGLRALLLPYYEPWM